MGVSPFDCVRKRFSGFYRFKRFKGGGAAHKNQKRRGVLEYMIFMKSEKPVNLLNLQNPLPLFASDYSLPCMKIQESNQITI